MSTPQNATQINKPGKYVAFEELGGFANIGEERVLQLPVSQETIDTCNVTGYNTHMIKSFAHKGLKEFYETGSKRGIQAEHASKLERMLDRLDASTSPQDMNLPGYRLHPLKGDKQDMWSVWVNGNWRMTFYFEDQDAYLVDYMDYH